uniref:Uncharacterized protein n=1 Tax=Rhizophora mucronata TaxID=61149 RepID=A0A2P2N5E5_RHIMU
MLGRAAGALFEHIIPNLATISTSPSLYRPFSLGSTTSRTLPFFNMSHTQSTSTSCSGNALGSMGLRPQTTSSRRAPNAYTSELAVAFPVLGSSGAR